MFKNYFTLNRHVVETNALLSGYTLSSVFTQEKDKLILCFTNNADELFVEINTDQAFPYFFVREKFNRAKKNTLDFFQDYLPSALHSIQIAEYDRIIKFTISDAAIYFVIRGKETNVILIDDEKKALSFKKIMNEEKLVEEISNIRFTSSFLFPPIDFNTSGESFSVQLKKYPYFGREIISSLEKRGMLNPESEGQNLLNQILHEVEAKNPFLVKDNLTESLELSFFAEEFDAQSVISSFETINDALRFFVSQYQKVYFKAESNKTLADKLEKKLKYLEKKQQHLSTRILAGCKDAEYQRIGNLLLLNLSKIKTGDKQIELEDVYQSNQPIVIDVNPKYKPKENADYYFHKAKSERKDYEESKRLLLNVEEEIIDLKKQISEAAVNDESQNSKKLSLAAGKNVKQGKTINQDNKPRFRQFILHDKYLIFVGRNSKNNDELTTGFAKQNDYWFHARSVSGSHVVLRWDKSFGEVQKSILEKAASVAAYYSKAKTSGLVPVSYTQKKYVIKRKGMEPGKVALLKEKVLIVKPEIPKECRIITE